MYKYAAIQQEENCLLFKNGLFKGEQKVKIMLKNSADAFSLN